MLYYIGKVKVHRKPTKHKLEPFSYTVYDSDTKRFFSYLKRLYLIRLKGVCQSKV